MEAPIFDLVTFLDILDWSQAASSFIKYGNSDEIKALCDRRKDKGGAELKKVIADLSYITQGLETSRGCFREEKDSGVPGVSVLKSYRSYEKFYGIMRKREKKEQEKEGRRRQINPLVKLFDVINDKLKGFDVEDNLAFGFAAIDWAIENKKTQQGFTALDETIKTWLCRRYGLDEYLESHREGICKALCSLFYDRMRYNGDLQTVFSDEGREEVYRAWEKFWERRWCGEENKKDQTALTPEKEREAARRLAMEMPPVLPNISGEIGSRRNSMNHFGYSNIGQFGSRSLYKDLEAYNDKFREIRELMEAEPAENGKEEWSHGEKAEEEDTAPYSGDGKEEG